MRFFRLLEQFDATLARSYEVWGHWFWRVLWILVVPLPVVYVLWVILWIGFTEITVDIQNNTDVDRPLVKVNVIDSSGKDMQSMGACCYWDKQRLVEVNWVFGVYQDQRVQGIKEEIRHKTVLLPERKLGAVYLHVLLLPNDEVKIWWGQKIIFPNYLGIVLVAPVKSTGGHRDITGEGVSGNTRGGDEIPSFNQEGIQNHTGKSITSARSGVTAVRVRLSSSLIKAPSPQANSSALSCVL